MFLRKPDQLDTLHHLPDDAVHHAARDIGAVEEDAPRRFSRCPDRNRTLSPRVVVFPGNIRSRTPEVGDMGAGCPVHDKTPGLQGKEHVLDTAGSFRCDFFG